MRPQELLLSPLTLRLLSGTPANPSTFQGNNAGCTAVTVAPGNFTFKEFVPPSVTARAIDTTGGCEVINIDFPPAIITVNGTIAADETQTCNVENTLIDVNTEGWWWTNKEE